MQNGKFKTEGEGIAAELSVRSGPPEPILERTFRFAVDVVKLGIELDRIGNVGRVLLNQILRAGTAVGSQVEEAQAAESPADFVSKLAVGLKEARETHYRLRVLSASGVHSGPALDHLITEADELKRILGKIIINTKRNRAGSPEMRPWTT